MKDAPCERTTRGHSGIVFFLLLAVTAFFCGCVNGPDDVIVLPPADTYYTKVAKGWLEFQRGNYENAITAFGEASDIDSTLPEAYLGLGWGYSMLGQMDNALSNFDLAIAVESESPHGYAAKAFVHLALSQYETAIETAIEAISLGGEEYVFGQFPRVNAENLRLLMAESYYATGQYANSREQVDILNPDNNLDQDSRTYLQELLLEIESLGSTMPVLEKSTD